MLVACLAFAATSCGGSDAEECTDELVAAPQPAWAMTALVDSVDWKATDVTTYREQGTLYIKGVAADSSQVILEFGDRPVIGIFPIRRGTFQAAVYVNQRGSKYYAPYGGTTGVINITSYAKDSLISGEFSFGATNTMDLHVISAGNFLAPVQKKDTSATAPAL